MKNSLWILLVLGVIVGVLPVMVSADPITDEDVSIEFFIDDGNPADLHDENGWLVAGSGISSVIRVDYTGSGSPDINFVRIISLEEDTYGKVKGKDAASLPCEVVFSASKKVAGNATIQVHINYTAEGIGYDYYRTVYQPIDHAAPKKIQNLVFEGEVTLNEMMNITMTMVDRYGNTVNSLYEDALGVVGSPEGVTFETTSYAGSGFYDGTGYGAESVTIPVNAEGSVVATFKAGTEAGPKYLIHVVPDIYVNDKWLTITALADAKPYAIVVSVDPNVVTPPYIPADGESKFYLTYRLFDRYGNPSGNQTLHFNDSVFEDEFIRRTNSDGEVKFTFGPFDRVTLFTIHAYAVENTSVTVDQELRFTNTSPEDMLLTANPQSMPSADVEAGFHADLLAKVTDESGNGVPGETVQFFITPPGLWDDAQELDPYLDDTPGVTDAIAITDIDGVATVHFTPGRFVTNISDDHYNATASESCTVVARWGTPPKKTRSIDLVWKNYPYLRVETEVNPETVQVGDPVEVTIRLIGDGYALSPDPIDVMLCVDRSWSMTYDSPDRMVSLMSALKVFNTEMTEGRDWVGMTSFGKRGTINYASDPYIVPKTYSDLATMDLPLTSLNRAMVNQTIDHLVPGGYTGMRYGLYLAINEIVGKPRIDAVQAVIVLSDGDYNNYGDPLARGTGYLYSPIYVGDDDSLYKSPTQSPFGHYSLDYINFSEILDVEEQNLSVYAVNHNITIYSISFGDGLTDNGIDTLKTLATGTGGKYNHAPTGDDLAAIYTKIAGELKTEAGVNTTMDVMFTNIEQNNVSVENDPSDPILEYEYEDGISTLVMSWNTTGSPPGSEDLPNIMGPLTFDQRNDWKDNQSLNFNTTEIGTIHLGQIWQAKFRLNISKPGNINIFGKESAIFFNNGEDFLLLPKTYITAVPYLNATGINFTGLEVSDLTCVEAEGGDVIENYLTMEWNLNYSGNYTATQYLYYQKVGDGIWIPFSEVPVTGPVSMLSHTRELYVADFPPGEYKLRVCAMAPDAPDSVAETLCSIVIGQGGQFFIRLE
ncbi:VWA domain-containing protein [Methanogenium marinum]|uniref:VWA domain-containing protein n=1 Tax=Methanogenium marinum TaxID=348610 RepID=A0A9Q4KSB8_9EURY|nr:VWA domain-containing protein [Methanogenium marinum]MDE4907847.1 VWA domain-containing protein [Methanogenium marinum]